MQDEQPAVQEGAEHDVQAPQGMKHVMTVKVESIFDLAKLSHVSWKLREAYYRRQGTVVDRLPAAKAKRARKGAKLRSDWAATRLGMSDSQFWGRMAADSHTMDLTNARLAELARLGQEID